MTEAKKKTLAILDRHLRSLEPSQFQIKVAGIKIDPGENSKSPKLGIDNEVGGHLKRAIPKDYTYDPKALKPLARMLWSMSVALGHSLTAHRQFTRIKSSTISPDGLVGGRGYVMAVKDVRRALYEACEGLSAISDTIHDELHAPHWQPKLAELEKSDIESVERLVGEAERILENPEDDVEDDLEEAEEEGTRTDLSDDEKEPKTQLPGNEGNNLADNYGERSQFKQASAPYTYRRGNSSEPVQTLPGPRVQHLDRGDTDQDGPFSSRNEDEPMSVKDNWSRDEGTGYEYAYPSEWDNELLDKTSGSNLPGILTDTTPTEARDFGLGYGEGNDAHGQGSEGYGTKDSDGKQVFGPYAELPKDPSGKLRDDVSDTTPTIELEVGRGNMPRQAAGTIPVSFKTPAVSERTLLTEENVERVVRSAGDVQIEPGQGISEAEMLNRMSSEDRNTYLTKKNSLRSRYVKSVDLSSAKWKLDSELPNDVLPSVARSDYYYGDKGDNPENVVTRASGDGIAEAETPGVPEKDYEQPLDVQPAVGYRYEQGYQPYVKWDSDTHNMRSDYVYQRNLEEGPYERN
jgi:hypothetical protein